MSTASFIRDLAHLLVRLDRGMLEFEKPPPQAVGEGLATALLGFGELALPILHDVLTETQAANDCQHLIDVLGRLGHASSAPFLIHFHQNYCSYESGLAAVQALRKLKTESAYLYLGELLTRYAQGDYRAVETRAELIVACQALGEWGDLRAIAPLEQARLIQ